MFRKILPILYVMWFLHMATVNNGFTLGFNQLTCFMIIANALAIGAIYVIGAELDYTFRKKF